MRLKAVEKLVHDEEVFLANYTDGLSDVNLNEVEEIFPSNQKSGLFR
jgi:hypothetical protein